MLKALKYHGWMHDNSKCNLVNEKDQGGYNLKFSPSFGKKRVTIGIQGMKTVKKKKKEITVTMTTAGNDLMIL